MERVSISNGELPVLLVAPHGRDDKNTDYLVDRISSEMNLFSVINRGWKKSKKFDYYSERANCNNIKHIHEEVVKDEFLDPILKSVARIQKKLDERVFIFYIHGCSDKVRIDANDDNLDIIVGYGSGSPSSYSCDLKYKNAFVHFLQEQSFGVYEGKKGGKYSGRSKNNLNQLFRLWHKNENVHSMQIEIINELRCEEELIEICCDGIISAIDELIMFDDAINIPNIKTSSI
jgi:hypothetical protein